MVFIAGKDLLFFYSHVQSMVGILITQLFWKVMSSDTGHSAAANTKLWPHSSSSIYSARVFKTYMQLNNSIIYC